MRDIFFDLSVRSVRLNFLRSILASVGIVIGVVAISAMGMLGTNMQLEVKDQLSAGANTIVITADAVRMGPPGSSPTSSVIIGGDNQGPAHEDQICCGVERQFGHPHLLHEYRVYARFCSREGCNLWPRSRRYH